MEDRGKSVNLICKQRQNGRVEVNSPTGEEDAHWQTPWRKQGRFWYSTCSASLDAVYTEESRDPAEGRRADIAGYERFTIQLTNATYVHNGSRHVHYCCSLREGAVQRGSIVLQQHIKSLFQIRREPHRGRRNRIKRAFLDRRRRSRWLPTGLENGIRSPFETNRSNQHTASEAGASHRGRRVRAV